MDKLFNIIKNIQYDDFKKIIYNDKSFELDTKYGKIMMNFLGKGGQGVVYSINIYPMYAIKFYKQPTGTNKVNIELLFLKKVKELKNKNITNNFLNLYGNISLFGRDVIIMNIIDGSLEEWVLVEHSDIEWLKMIFQILYGTLIMQKCLQTYHADMKPKNILFNNITETNFNYEINEDDNYYKINFISKQVFIISDFGHASSLLNDFKRYSKIPESSIKLSIENNLDLEHLSSFYKRLAVTIISNSYTLNDLLNIGKDDKYFNAYLDNEKTQIENTMGHYSYSVKNHMLFRSLAYYLLEKDYFDIDDLPNIGKTKINLPSPYIRNILESLSLTKGYGTLVNKIKEIGNLIMKNESNNFISEISTLKLVSNCKSKV